MLSAGSIIVPTLLASPGIALVHRDHPAMDVRVAGLEHRLGLCLPAAPPVHRLRHADDAAVQGAPRPTSRSEAAAMIDNTLRPLPDPALCRRVPRLPARCRWSSWAAPRSTIRSFPSVYPWVGLTDRWFVDLWNDRRMWIAVRNTVLVALAVVAISRADRHGGRDPDQQPAVARALVPLRRDGGADPDARRVIGISTLLFWNQLDVPAGPAPLRARPGLVHRRLRHAARAGAAAELRPGARGGGARPRRQPSR